METSIKGILSYSTFIPASFFSAATFRAEVLGSELLLTGFFWSSFLGVVLARFFSPRAFRSWIPKRCKGVHCVDLGESFPKSVYVQILPILLIRAGLRSRRASAAVPARYAYRIHSFCMFAFLRISSSSLPTTSARKEAAETQPRE